MRRTVVRYACLSLTITFRMMCPTVKKRFPTMEHMVEAGLMLPNEKKIFDKLEEKTVHPKYWLPLVWASSIITRARREDKIKNDFGLICLIKEVNKFRSGCGSLLNYDWISVPLVYTQVVTLAVFTYFIAALMGNQYLDPKKGYPTHTIDLVIPIFTLLQFFFYMGWLMVAETLVNPFGEDDDDFEVNWLIDRNIQISYLIVDEVHEDHPALVKDQYWEEVFPTELPYTEAAKQYYMEPFLGSAQAVEVPLHQRGIILMPVSIEEQQITVKNVEIEQTVPLQINSLFALMKTKNTTLPSFRRSTSKTVMSMLGNNISEENTNFTKKKSKEVLDNKPCNNSKSQEQSINSTSRNNFNDFQEDVFRMSDFSVAESLDKLQLGFKTYAASIRKAKKSFPLAQDNFTSDHNSPENVSTSNIKHDAFNTRSSKINETFFKANDPCIRSHWKRDRCDNFLINNSEHYLESDKAEFKGILKNILKEDELGNSENEFDDQESLEEFSENIQLDQQIVLEKSLASQEEVTSYKQQPIKNIAEINLSNLKLQASANRIQNNILSVKNSPDDHENSYV